MNGMFRKEMDVQKNNSEWRIEKDGLEKSGCLGMEKWKCFKRFVHNIGHAYNLFIFIEVTSKLEIETKNLHHYQQKDTNQANLFPKCWLSRDSGILG